MSEIKALQQTRPHERAVDSDYGGRGQRDSRGGGLPIHGNFEVPQPPFVRQVPREDEKDAAADLPGARVTVSFAVAAGNGTRGS